MMRGPEIRIIPIADGLFEIYRGRMLYGIASTEDDSERVAEEAETF
jgi:hypothetical protein